MKSLLSNIAISWQLTTLAPLVSSFLVSCACGSIDDIRGVGAGGSESDGGSAGNLPSDGGSGGIQITYPRPKPAPGACAEGIQLERPEVFGVGLPKPKEIVAIPQGESARFAAILSNTLLVLERDDGVLRERRIEFENDLRTIVPLRCGTAVAVVVEYGGESAADQSYFLHFDAEGQRLESVQALAIDERIHDMAIGDITGDGVADIVISTESGLHVAHGDEDCSFVPLVPWSPIGNRLSLLISDLDADGLGEVVGIIRGTTDAVVITSRDDSGKVIDRVLEISQPRRVGLHDVDRDGRLDLVIAHAGIAPKLGAFSVDLSYWDAETREIKQFENLPFMLLVSALQSADVDGDGRMDLVVGSTDGVGTIVLYGEADGYLKRAYDGTAGGALLAADVDGDGATDILVGAFREGVQLARNRGSRVFTGRNGWLLPASPFGLEVGDFDCDGKLDLAASLPDSGDLIVVWSRRDLQRYPTGRSPSALAWRQSHECGALVVVDSKSDVVETFTFGADRQVDRASLTALPASFEIAVGEVDRRNGPDIVFASTVGQQVAVMFDEESGFTDPQAVQSPGAVSSLTIIPVDGKPTIFAGRFYVHRVDVVGATEGGGLEKLGELVTGPQPLALSSCDWDRDGNLDLVVSAYGERELQIWDAKAYSTGEEPIARFPLRYPIHGLAAYTEGGSCHIFAAGHVAGYLFNANAPDSPVEVMMAYGRGVARSIRIGIEADGSDRFTATVNVDDGQVHFTPFECQATP